MEKLKKMLGERFQMNVPMKEHTTFKTGGPADYFLTPKDELELSVCIKTLHSAGVPYLVLGNGSNLLVRDGGVAGAVIFMGGIKGISVEENHLCVMAGNLLSEAAGAAQRSGLSGLEFASGIPGSVGGGVCMNAGAYGGELKDVLTGVRFLDDKGEVRQMPAEELKLGYRKSLFHERPYIALEAQFSLSPGEPDEIRAKMSELNARRREKQPLEYPSAGSTFKRPEGYFAGKLIEDAGLKGFRVGGAMVSEKHAGFVINYERATSADILALIDQVRRRVFEVSGVMLEPEVKIIGRDKTENIVNR